MTALGDGRPKRDTGMHEADLEEAQDKIAAILAFREGVRIMLRAWEDLHGLPHSFRTKREEGRR